MSRFRRTNRMIEIDKLRVNNNLNEIPWANITGDQMHTINADPLMDIPQVWYSQEYATQEYAATNLDPVGEFSKAVQALDLPAKAADQAEPAVNPVKYTVIDDPADPGVAREFQLTVESAAVKAVNSAIGPAVNAVFAELDRRTAEIVQKTAGSKVIAAIKINDQAAVKIDDCHPMLPELVALTKASGMIGCFPLLVGPAGSGKTLLAGQVAKALGLEFGHLCFSAGASEVWLYGRQTPTGFIEGEFSKMYRDGGLYLADEIDAADANLLLVLNTSLANGHLYNPISGQLIKRNANFVFIAAANTFGKGGTATYTGRSRLDGATLDRSVSFPVTYLPEVEEKLAMGDREILDLVRKLRSHVESLGGEEIVSYRTLNKAIMLKALGKTTKAIVDTLTASWTEDLKRGI